MTGRLWPSALVAALFAIHPLRVDSVAWAAARKDLLTGLFFVLTVWAYVEYAGKPFSILRYLLVVACFALGLMAKPMLVTLPAVLLLLDYWPLGRMTMAAREDTPLLDNRRQGRFSPSRHLLAEKVPLLLLVVVSCVLTVWAQGQALVSIEYLPLSWRIGNALISYVVYLGQSFYPVGLAVLYPRPGLDLPLWKILGAFLVLVAITAAALLGRRRCPYLLVGWLWYLGTLVPVIGLVQIGAAATADRFTYVPQIGLCVALVWGGAEFFGGESSRRWLGCVAVGGLLAGLMGMAWRQTTYWHDSESLWNQARVNTSVNFIAHNNLGLALASRGQFDEAIVHYKKAIEIQPDFVMAHNNFGNALAGRGQFDEAIVHYKKAIEIQPDYAKAHHNFGNALAGRRQFDEAITEIRKAIEIQPDYAEAHNDLGLILAGRGQTDEAVVHYKKAIEIQPDNVGAHYNLGNALAGRGQFGEAIAHYKKAIEIQPDNVGAHNNFGNALAGRGQFDEAIAHYKKAIEIYPDFVLAHYNLGNALASRGQFDEAIAHYKKAIEIQPDHVGAHNHLGQISS